VTRSLVYRDLTTLAEFAQVVDLEREIWGVGYGDVVPVPIFAVTVKRGGILAGAFDGDRLVGFVYSLPGIKAGITTQWSHMLGVLDAYRGAGVGRALKLWQRDRALAMGLDLIEWTFDPLQAFNAHLNFTRLGAIAHEYEENVYGASTSVLHRGNPTDRLIAEWWIRRPHVERRIAGPALMVRSHDVAAAEAANRVTDTRACGEVRLTLDAQRIRIEIPTGFTDMLADAPALASDWRLRTRELFQTYFGRGYRAVDFSLDTAGRRGAYLLARER
jgi:chorismate synthase